MAEKVKKYIEDKDEWEVQHFIDYARTGKKPINPEWDKRRREALEDADLELDDDGPKPAEEQSVEEIAKGMESTKQKVGD